MTCTRWSSADVTGAPSERPFQPWHPAKHCGTSCQGIELLSMILSVMFRHAVRFLEFVWLPTFERISRKLLSRDDERAIEAVLCADLGAGDVIRRTGGFRKLRLGLEGRGKSGGVRIVYFPDERCERIYMILAYRKGTKETLTRAEENALRRLSAQLKKEGC
ncbi:MAG TPA: type II toxin-antitoxin system RelE/ParE family toxin [Gemmatimonadaceae bacterium]|nr:type II toxin-antitoxin system RelE/ParE family toxin [Gemmatimonadaceae bacterium]